MPGSPFGYAQGRLCRHYDISPQAFYRWRRRYNPRDLASLEERSRRPHRTRRPTWGNELALAVQELREQYPWGKDKLAVLLREQGWACSVSMVGRILSSLQRRGVVGKVSLKDPWQRSRPLRRPYGVRKPKEYAARGPGDIVQVDTAHIQPCPGWNFRHYTARDVVTRWDVLEAYGRATAHTAAGFLDTILTRMPFPVKAIQSLP